MGCRPLTFVCRDRVGWYQWATKSSDGRNPEFVLVAGVERRALAQSHAGACDPSAVTPRGGREQRSGAHFQNVTGEASGQEFLGCRDGHAGTAFLLRAGTAGEADTWGSVQPAGHCLGPSQQCPRGTPRLSPPQTNAVGSVSAVPTARVSAGQGPRRRCFSRRPRTAWVSAPTAVDLPLRQGVSSPREVESVDYVLIDEARYLNVVACPPRLPGTQVSTGKARRAEERVKFAALRSLQR